MPIRPTAEVVARYYSLLSEKKTHNEAIDIIASERGVQRDSVRRYVSEARQDYFRTGQKGSEVSTRSIEGATIESPKVICADRTPKEVWDSKLDSNERNIHDEEAQRNVTIRCEDYLPIGLAWISDHHFDDPRADLVRAKMDAETVRDTHGLYLASGGDELNWYLKQIDRFPKWDDWAEPVKDRFDLFRYWLSVVFPKMVIAVAGNHNYYFYSRGGLMIEHEKYKEHGIHCSKDYINPEFIVGGETYIGHFAHTFWGRSRLNPAHEIVRAFRHCPGGLRPDVVGVGHRHDEVIISMQIDGRHGVGMKSGSYKWNSADFEGQNTISQASPFMPMVIFLPDIHRMIPFENIQRGAEYLNDLRESYRKGDSIEATN